MGEFRSMMQFWKEVWMFLGSMILYFIAPMATGIYFIYLIVKGIM